MGKVRGYLPGGAHPGGRELQIPYSDISIAVPPPCPYIVGENRSGLPKENGEVFPRKARAKSRVLRERGPQLLGNAAPRGATPATFPYRSSPLGVVLAEVCRL